jgi:hypothetical protein
VAPEVLALPPKSLIKVRFPFAESSEKSENPPEIMRGITLKMRFFWGIFFEKKECFWGEKCDFFGRKMRKNVNFWRGKWRKMAENGCFLGGKWRKTAENGCFLGGKWRKMMKNVSFGQNKSNLCQKTPQKHLKKSQKKHLINLKKTAKIRHLQVIFAPKTRFSGPVDWISRQKTRKIPLFRAKIDRKTRKKRVFGDRKPRNFGNLGRKIIGRYISVFFWDFFGGF